MCKCMYHDPQVVKINVYINIMMVCLLQIHASRIVLQSLLKTLLISERECFE